MSKKVHKLEEIGFFDNEKKYVRMDAYSSLEILANSLQDKNGMIGINEYSAIMSLRDIIYEQNKQINRLKENINGWI